MKEIRPVALLLVASLCLLTLTARQKLTAETNPDHAERNAGDEAAVRKVLALYEDSWNLHDMKTFGSVFTEDCDYVNIAGVHWKGVEENVRQHATLFQSRLAGVTQSQTSVQVRFPKPGVALVLTTWDATGYTRPTGEKLDVLKEITTMVMIKTNRKWLITAFQNTEVRSPLVPQTK